MEYGKYGGFSATNVSHVSDIYIALYKPCHVLSIKSRTWLKSQEDTFEEGRKVVRREGKPAKVPGDDDGGNASELVEFSRGITPGSCQEGRKGDWTQHQIDILLDV